MEGRHRPLNVRGMLLADSVIGLVAPMVSTHFGALPSLHNFVAGQVYSHCIGTLAHMSLMWGYHHIASWRPGPRWAAVVLILALDATVGCAVASVLMALLGYYGSDLIWKYFQSSYQISLTITMIFGVTGLITETLRSRLEGATRQWERAMHLATEARLSSLESRIHPHFLFNALNSISSLVREDPDRAERLIERMAALLRFSLDSSQRGVVTIEQELEIVRGYLEIEKARFGERLQFYIELPAEAMGSRVPPLSVQTLVENSVKHAISPRREGGSIAVTARVAGPKLQVEVRDQGPGVNLAAAPAGHGIDLLQSRLQVLYEGEAELRAEGSSILLTIPCSAPTLLTTKS